MGRHEVPVDSLESDEASVGKRTILLVEDHPSIRLILTAGFKAHGFEVLTAATGEKAMALLKGSEGAIDLLLTDVALLPPELTPDDKTDAPIPHGLALAEQAIQIRPSLKIILFTGHSDERLKSLGVATDRFLLLRKPCGLPKLIQTFRQLLGQPDHEHACGRATTNG